LCVRSHGYTCGNSHIQSEFVLHCNKPLKMDASAKYLLKMPAVAKSLSPSSPLFELVQAVVAGDAEITRSMVNEPSFDVKSLVAALDSSGVTVLHIAAMANRPEIMHVLLRAADAITAQQAELAKLQTRKEAMYVRGAASDSGSRQGQLDALDRLKCIASEQQFLELLSTADRCGRTVLHYAAAARGVMVDDGIFGYEANRFAHAVSSDMHHTPLFPHGCYVDVSCGEIWSATTSPDEVDLGPPESYIPVGDLLRARNDPGVIDAKDINDATPLVYATVAGDLRAIRCLIEHGADTFASTADGLSVLDCASNRVVRAALVPLTNAVQSACGMHSVRAGVKPPFPGATAMLSPARSTSGTSTIIPQGSSSRRRPSSTTQGGAAETPVRHTADSAHVAENALMLLVNSGEDINGRTGIHLRGPLHVAAEQGALDVVQLLLNNGARVDIVDVNGCTPVHLAAELGTPVHQEVVKRLALAGADVNATSSLRKSPLHCAATVALRPHTHTHRTAVKENDLENEATGIPDGGASTSRSGYSHTLQEDHDGNAAMIALLVQLGANIEAVDTEENTPLHVAAKRGNFLAADTLLTLGARIYAQNIRGHTPLHLAAFHHNIPVVRQLCRWDAEVGKLKYVLDSSGRSAYDLAADPPTRESLHTLFEACGSGRLDLVQSVSRAGSSIPLATCAAWYPVRAFEVTRMLRRSCLHVAVSGAAKALAIYKHSLTERKDRVSLAAAHGSGKRARANPSAVHTVSGIGFRFTPASQSGKVDIPPDMRTKWTGSSSDVSLSFFEPLDRDISLFMDSFAYTVAADTGTHVSMKPGSAESASIAMKRAQPGSELTSTLTEKEYGRVLEWLLKSGCNVNDKDVDDVTPAMLCARYGLLYLLRKLLSKNADVLAVDRRGNTVLHYAYAFRHLVAASVIGEYAPESLHTMRNVDGNTALDVAGSGLAILADTAERLVIIRKPVPKSAMLTVSAAT
jgi:ankyrin repeat protein